MRALVESPTTVELPLAERYISRRYVKLVLALGALCGIGPLTVDTYLSALPALRADFGVTDVQA
jgi:MFS transporter, DHA1 family, multidrug resistance protein